MWSRVLWITPHPRPGCSQRRRTTSRRNRRETVKDARSSCLQHRNSRSSSVHLVGCDRGVFEVLSNSPRCKRVFPFCSSLYGGADDAEGQPSERSQKHWTCQSAHHAYQDPHQPSQACSRTYQTPSCVSVAPVLMEGVSTAHTGSSEQTD